MSKIVFSLTLFEQLGGSNWLVQPDRFESPAPEQSNKTKVIEPKAVLSEETLVGDKAPRAQIIEKITTSKIKTKDISLVQSSADLIDTQVDLGEHNLPKVTDKLEPSFVEPLANKVVVLGTGLDAVWQNETNQAWLLWQNIMRAFDWEESQITFFDTNHLVSEGTIYATIEEIIDMGVDWILTMDETHAISEQLAEGICVITVPDLETMLSDAYSKQVFYQTVIELKGSL